MAQLATVQQRIRQFEALDDSRVLRVSDVGSHPSYPPAPRVMCTARPAATSAPAHVNNFIEEPISPSAASCTIMKPSIPYVPRKPHIKSPSPSPPNLGCNTSLINLKDWIVEDGPKVSMSSSQATVTGKRLKVAPPLPPRSWSQSSAMSSTVSLGSRSSSGASPSATSPTSTNSRVAEHSHPPLSHDPPLRKSLRQCRSHMNVSSISSFQSVSLSDGDADGIKPVLSLATTSDQEETAREADRDSLDDAHSFEAISSTGFSSPTMSSTYEWVKDFSSPSICYEPLRRPSRRKFSDKLISDSNHSRSYDPLSVQLSLSSSPSVRIRRMPPPPPSRATKPPVKPVSSRASVMSAGTSASDRSSVLSNSTMTTTHTSIGSYVQLLRPTPVPRVARERYESLFFANVNAQRRVMMNIASQKLNSAPPSDASSSASPINSRRGWRGLSVDLVPSQEQGASSAVASSANTDDDMDKGRLGGKVVRRIWQKSRLPIGKLRDIWNECVLPSQNSLDKDSFIRGMWRIDEELRREQTQLGPWSTQKANLRLL